MVRPRRIRVVALLVLFLPLDSLSFANVPICHHPVPSFFGHEHRAHTHPKTRRIFQLRPIPFALRLRATQRQGSTRGSAIKTSSVIKTEPTTRQRSTLPTHWSEDSDEVLQGSNELKFKVHGQPLPLRRHRTSRGFMYNPSAASQESFRNVVRSIFFAEDNAKPEPYFDENQAISITLIFRTKRPLKDFVGNKPGEGRLRPFDGDKGPFADSPISPATRTDVDNLAKFVMDSLNGVLYEDDKQIVSLRATKVRDNNGDCLGSTEVHMRIVDEDDVEELLLL